MITTKQSYINKYIHTIPWSSCSFSTGEGGRRGCVFFIFIFLFSLLPSHSKSSFNGDSISTPAPSLRLGSPMLITSEYVLAWGEASALLFTALAVTVASLAIGCQHGVSTTSFRLAKPLSSRICFTIPR